jgi:hypothetical protein
MSEVVVKDHSIQEETVAHQHPLETIPQGSQNDGVLNGHDLHDVNPDALYKFTVGLFALIIASLVLCWFITTRLLDSFEADDTVPSATFAARPLLEEPWPAPPLEAELQSPEAAPDLQPDPEKPLLKLREQEDAQLYGTPWQGGNNWVTNEKGERVAVSIPIEDAMQLTLERGLPTEVKAQVDVRKPTGDVAEMGSIPPSETELEKLAAKNGRAAKDVQTNGSPAAGAKINQGKTRAGMAGY